MMRPGQQNMPMSCKSLLFFAGRPNLLIAAANTGKFVNIKKGQFVSAESMKFAVEKVRQSGNHNIFLTERGTTFGYNDLVVDFRGIPSHASNWRTGSA